MTTTTDLHVSGRARPEAVATLPLSICAAGSATGAARSIAPVASDGHGTGGFRITFVDGIAIVADRAMTSWNESDVRPTPGRLEAVT
ncbi:hypothetical protein [Ilumatobacter sp.]|uniref:hypothetical protein n=1 Tax=Ilumatobacter sp. TaxID=1967498 RepID=UPI003B528359